VFLCYNFYVVPKILALKYWPLMLLTVLIVAIVGMSRYAENRKASATADTQPCSPQFSVSPNDADKSAKNTSNPNNSPSWVETFTWPEGVTAWALLFTLLVIAWQSTETRAAAQASKASIRLQEATMQQWVDAESLGCYIQTPPAGKRDFPFTVNLRFEAVNNTSYPFDIQKIVTKIGMWPYEWEVFVVETNVTLASQEKSRSKRYAFYVPTQSITEEQFRQGTVLTINGEVTFKNCLGRTQTGYFGGIYRCGQIDSKQEGIFQYLEALGIVPERTNEKENPQNPN
jgi:hypothetical protein